MVDIFTVVVASATASPWPHDCWAKDTPSFIADQNHGPIKEGEEYTSDQTSNEDKSLSISLNCSSSHASDSKTFNSVELSTSGSAVATLDASDSMNQVNNNNYETQGVGEEEAPSVDKKDHEMNADSTFGPILPDEDSTRPDAALPSSHVDSNTTGLVEVMHLSTTENGHAEQGALSSLEVTTTTSSSYKATDPVPTPSINKSSRTEQSMAITTIKQSSTSLIPMKSPPMRYITQPVEGYMKLIHRSDTQYLVAFDVFATPFARIVHDTKTRVVFTCDLDDVDFADDLQCLFIKSLEIKVHIIDPYFYVQFKQGCEEAAYLTECKLRLGIMARDCYYTALFKGVDKYPRQQKNLTQDSFDAMKTGPFRESHCQQTVDAIIQEIIATKNTMHMDPRDVRQKYNTKGKIYNVVGDSSTHNNHRNNNKRRSSEYIYASPDVTTKKPDVGPTYTDDMIYCLFCLVSRAVDKKRPFYLHPFVPHKHNGGTLFMCGPCLNNWQLYRETVSKNFGSLILPNEVNEELCAVCSDTPEKLVLCSTCERSFCDPCLTRTCSGRELGRVKNSDQEWSCMNCVSGIQYKSIQLMDKNTWIKAKTGYQGVILPKRSHRKRERKDVPRSASSSSGRASSQESDTRPALFDTGKADLNAMLMAGFDVQEDSQDEAETVPVLSMNAERDISGNMSTPSGRSYVRTRGGGSGGHRNRGRVSGMKYIGTTDLIAPPPHVTASTISTISTQPIDDSKPKPKPRDRSRDRSRKKNKVRGGPSEDRTDSFMVTYAPTDERALPAVTKNMSEDTYFANYVNYVDDFYDKNLGHSVVKGHVCHNTEDVCFLCKDGGELMECDYSKKQHSKHKIRANCKCLKVYHDYCLSYAVPDGSTWFCPRHYCDNCASRNVKYVCKYCPVSVCVDCPNDMVRNYDISRYVSLEVPKQGWEFGPDVEHIICQTCLAMFTKCFKSSQREGSGGRLISLDHPAYRNQLRSFETLPSPVDKVATAARRQKLQQYMQQQGQRNGAALFHNNSSSSAVKSSVPPLNELVGAGRSADKRHRDDSPGYSKSYTSRQRRDELFDGDEGNQSGECLFLGSNASNIQDADLESIAESSSNYDLAASAVNQEDQIEADFANAGIPLN